MPDKHLSSQFDAELNQISTNVMEIGGLVSLKFAKRFTHFLTLTSMWQTMSW